MRCTALFFLMAALYYSIVRHFPIPTVSVS
jgi:hypothetical protein